LADGREAHLLGSCRISLNQWEALAASYRTVPGHHTKAAAAAGVGRRVARTCWDRGYDDPVWARVPLRDLTADSSRLVESFAVEMTARAVTSTLARMDDTALLSDLERRVRVRMGVREARELGLKSLASLRSLSDALTPHVQSAVEKLALQANAGDFVSLPKLLDMLGDVGSTYRTLMSAYHDGIKAEALALGGRSAEEGTVDPSHWSTAEVLKVAKEAGRLAAHAEHHEELIERMRGEKAARDAAKGSSPVRLVEDQFG